MYLKHHTTSVSRLIMIATKSKQSFMVCCPNLVVRHSLTDFLTLFTKFRSNNHASKKKKQRPQMLTHSRLKSALYHQKQCFFFGVTGPGSDFFGENQHLLKACNTKHVKKSSSLVVSSPPTEAAKWYYLIL